MIKVGVDFSGVGAFEQALIRLGIDFKTVFACDIDKFARQTYIHNYGEPEYFPDDVYKRIIPDDPLDIYMTSPPCQAFSLAGKRKGEKDERGILFYNSHEFIKKNKPRYFIFENVKGLLSDDNGKTFQRWIDYLGGKSVNGNPVIFPTDEAVPYHIYWQVLNAKDYGVPQNRERVFIVGIRDDQDNDFSWPKPFPLKKRLKDVLEEEVDEKYFLSENAISRLTNDSEGYHSEVRTKESVASTVCASDYNISRGMNILKVKSATKSGFEIATENDSINFTHPKSETRRGRVGKGVAQTLDTGCNQGVMIARIERTEEAKAIRRETGSNPFQMKKISFDESNVMNCITTATTKDNLIKEDYRIRRLTPREAFRLMDFPDTFTWPVSDSQAYKQAGNSIVVNVLAEIIKKLKL